METRDIRFRAPGLEVLRVESFREEHHLGVPATLDVEVICAASVDPAALAGALAELAFGRGGQVDRAFVGVIAEATSVASPDEAGAERRLRLRVVSQLGLLAWSVHQRIFQEKDVKEIVTEVLGNHGLAADRQRWRLLGAYPRRTYCVQYAESALAFVQRLLEEEGIFFFSEPGDDGREVLVFEDDSGSCAPIDGAAAIRFVAQSGMSQAEETITAITARHRVVSGAFTLRSWDFEHPDVDLTVSATTDRDADLEVYDYPGTYADRSRGERLARVRLEAAQAQQSTLVIESSSPRLSPGRKLRIDGAPGELDGGYVITGVMHAWAPPRAGSPPEHLATAWLVPESVPFRAPLATPRPVIEGPQTAEIVAPEGSPAETIHTDLHGRCKVKFHWDLAPAIDDTASCWMRVTQLQTTGSMILPRVGWEVIVEFVEGDPDRPVVTGMVYNGANMPPYALPEGKTRTALGTASTPGGAGRNHLRMEDKAGSEEMAVGAQKNQSIATANDKTKDTAVDETKTVGASATLTVGANQTVKVTGGHETSIGGSRSVSVGGNRAVAANAVLSLSTGGASATSVGGNQMEMDGDPLTALLALAVQKVEEAAQEKAAETLAALDAAVQSKVDQAMGPIHGLIGKAKQLGDGMKAMSHGDLGPAAGVLGQAAGLPGAGELGKQLGAEPAGGGTRDLGPPADRGAADRSGGGGMEAVQTGGAEAPLGKVGSLSKKSGLDSMIHGALGKGADALKDALGAGGGGGGGSSEANAAGPDGTAGGNAAAHASCGPGHAITKVAATHAETIGGLKVTLAAGGVKTNVTGARSLSVGAASLELVGGARSETVVGSKTEKAVGLVVIASGAESEAVGAARSTTVGGAILQKIGASHAVSAATATFVGALHKVDASGSIVFKCGGSEVVISGGGIKIKAALVTISAPSVKLPRAVTEI